MERFWLSIRNKAKLESLFYQKALAYIWNEPTPVSSSVTFAFQKELNYACSTAGAEVSELNITMEEADARIVPRVMHEESVGLLSCQQKPMSLSSWCSTGMSRIATD